MIRFIEFLRTNKHFCLIQSPIDFTIICNPQGNDLLKGTDVLSLPAGAFAFDFWKLLPEKYFKNNPAFTVGIAYDDTELVEGEEVKVSYSDIDFGNGIAGLADGDNLVADIDHRLAEIVSSQGNISGDVNALRVGGLADLADVKADVFNLGREIAEMRGVLNNIGRFVIPFADQPWYYVPTDEDFYAVLKAGCFLSIAPDVAFRCICLNDCVLHYHASSGKYYVFGLLTHRGSTAPYTPVYECWDEGMIDASRGQCLQLGGLIYRLDGYDNE